MWFLRYFSEVNFVKEEMLSNRPSGMKNLSPHFLILFPDTMGNCSWMP